MGSVSALEGCRGGHHIVIVEAGFERPTVPLQRCVATTKRSHTLPRPLWAIRLPQSYPWDTLLGVPSNLSFFLVPRNMVP